LYANCGTINLKNGTVENNTANNGGGGGLFIVNGGLIKITGGFVRYNHATGDNTYGTMKLTSSDFDGENRYNGAGGGICVGKGYNVASEFTMPDKDDNGNTITIGRGIYGNTATFSADDVCSVGYGTQLNVPNKAEMDLSEYSRYVVGWFEDYANGDPQYTNGTNVANGTYSVGSRYRKNMNNTYDAKYIIQNVNSNSTGNAVNAANAYVNMTLGYTVYIDVKKVVKDPQGNLLRDNASLYNKYKDINYEFTLSRTDGTALSAAEIKYVTINSDGTLGTTEIDATGGKFKLKDGESVRFPYLSEDVGYQVVESDNIADVYKTETACVYKDQVYDNVDNYNGTYTAATDLGDEFYANISVGTFNVAPTDTQTTTLADKLSVTLGSTNTAFKKQVWHFYHQSDGSYKIKNESNGKYLAVVNYNGSDSASTAFEDESYTDNQKWFIYNKDGKYFFVSKVYNNLALDCNNADITTLGNTVGLYSFHGNYNQLFTIDKSCGGDDLATDLEDDFWARISNSYSGTKYITLNNSNAAVVADLNTNDQKQLWHFVKQSDGSYLISNGSNRYCLDNANKTDNLSTYDQFIASTENGTNAQKWFIYKQSDGTYMFRAANTIDKIMDQDTNSSQIGEWNNDSGLSNNPTQRRFAITTVSLSEVTEPSDKSAVINKLSGQTVEMTFTNYIATGKLPATGSFGIMLVQIIGFAVVVLFVALIAVRTFRKKGRYNKV
ncbi:MAG: RICIN domain-containing protein, partial [Acutalibacteraceae bacterium]